MALKPLPITDDELNILGQRLLLKNPVSVRFLEQALKQTIVFDGKQSDYGPANIADFGTYGVVVRMNDKFRRIAHLFQQGRRRRPVNEAIRDSFLDIANYAIIAHLLETNNWGE